PQSPQNLLRRRPQRVDRLAMSALRTMKMKYLAIGASALRQPIERIPAPLAEDRKFLTEFLRHHFRRRRLADRHRHRLRTFRISERCHNSSTCILPSKSRPSAFNFCPAFRTYPATAPQVIPATGTHPTSNSLPPPHTAHQSRPHNR